MADNKSEKATPQRRKKAREQGSVPRSRELTGALSLAAVVATVMVIAPSAIKYWGGLYRETLNVAATQNIDTNGPVLFWTSLEAARWIVPISLAAMAVSLFSGFAQGGVSFAPKAMELKFDRFNPTKKLGQMFSSAGVANMLKSLIPFAAMLFVVTGTIRGHWEAMIATSSLGMRELASLIGSMLFEVGWKSVLILLIWSAVDYLLIWRKAESDLKMTKQEIKEEYKETDGNPVIKRRVHQVRNAMRKAQSLKAAATATVVITNPTHFAIALKYDPDMPAPIVVAKGADLIALKIKEIAREAGIMTIENRPLAQALFKTVEVGDSIPAKLYQAVAEILVTVYRAQAEVQARDAARRTRNASGQAAPTSPSLQTGAAR
ncbi:MAG TPA: EscU/YscU/HrcU family type III secretion system export apparatus switch protein [Acidobacteriaceae bacterium]|jgi:flagellar biosynthetic protein FlhB